MTHATHYTRTTGFADDERNNAGGRSTVATADVDFELDAIAQAVNQTIDNATLLQRDDGVMRDGAVPVSALGADTLKILTTGTSTPRGAWVTATIYNAKDLVTQSGNTYICVAVHTSGTFATDLGAAKWLLFQIGANPSAAAIQFAPTANVLSTTVQAAVAEVDTNARSRGSQAAADLADTVSAAKNAGLIGFNYALAYGANTIGKWLKDLSSSTGSTFVGFIAAGVGAVLRSVQAKLRDTASVLDYGVVGDDATDDTAAVNAALSSGYGTIEIPHGLVMKITGSVVIPPGVVLRGKTGRGRLGARPSYFHVTNALATAAVTVDANAWADHVNVLFAIANTAIGIQGIGNGCRISRCQVEASGSDGIRIGTAGGANCNSFNVEDNYVLSAGGNGCYIHDGTAASGANANAGRVVNQVSQNCTGSSIKLGHCFWVSVDNPLGEGCSRYAVEVSGTTNNGVPECRYASIMMGDSNEANTLGAVFDQGYFTQWVQPDTSAIPSNAGTGVAGSGLYQILCNRANKLLGATVYTNSGQYPAVVDDGVNSSLSYGLTIKKKTGGANNHGTGIAFSIDPNTGTPVTAGGISCLQTGAGVFGLLFSGYAGGAPVNYLELSPSANCFNPLTDNTLSLGLSSNRWSVVYAGTGAINTSDANTKQQVAELTDAEKRVAARIKGMMRTFRFNDSVAEKGDGARIHAGAIAQDVQAAFVAEGLDATRYALFCSDTWWEFDGKPVQADANGIHEVHTQEVDESKIPAAADFAPGERQDVIDEAIEHARQQATTTTVTKVQAVSVTRLGLRYEELFAFVIAAL